MCVPSWYTHCFLRACVFSRLSRSFFLSHHSAQTNKTNRAFCSTKTHAFRPQNRLNRLLITKSIGRKCCFRRKNQTFRGTLILLSLISSSSSSFFSSVSFSRERGKDTSSFPRARERTRSEEHREKERDLFLINENVLLLGTKMGTKSTASLRRRRTRRTTTTTQRVDGGNDATPHRGFTDGEAAVDELGEDDTNYC